MRRLGVLVVAAALAIAGCRTSACKKDTVLVSFALGGATSGATSLTFSITVDNGPPTTGSVKPSGLHGTVEIFFPNGYPLGKTLSVTVAAADVDGPLADLTQSILLTAACHNMSFSLDGGSLDGSLLDGSALDGSALDGDTSDAGVVAPRLLSPLSTAHVTSRRPTLRWLNPSALAVQIDLCKDRACTTPVGINVTVTSEKTSGKPDSDLPIGLVYWRARATGTQSMTWAMWVGARSAAIDTSHGTVLDVNGDGFADVIVGALTAHDAANNPNAGRAFLYLGGPTGLAVTPQVIDGRDGTGATFASSVASAGDVDGDGYADVIIGSSGAKDGAGNSGAGRAYLFLGGAGGLSSVPQRIEGQDGANAFFGNSVAGAGDVNGDGYADVIIGANRATNGAGATNAGRAYLYLGGPGGLSLPSPALEGQDGANAFFGNSVAGAGDVNGDGYADVIIGANQAVDVANNANAGRAYLYLGGPGGLTAQPPINSRDGLNGNFGFSVASAGDVDGDGRADVIIGADGAKDAAMNTSAGRAYLFLGTASGLSANPQLLDGQAGQFGLFGGSVAGVGDVNGDGYFDVVVGAANATGTAGSGVGKAYLYLGGPTGLTGPVNPTLDPGEIAGAGFGRSVASPGDVNGDGNADVIIGADNAKDTAGDSGAGRAYFYLGAPGGLAATPRTLDGPNTNAHFGGNVAWSIAREPRRAVRARHSPRFLRFYR